MFQIKLADITAMLLKKKIIVSFNICGTKYMYKKIPRVTVPIFSFLNLRTGR